MAGRSEWDERQTENFKEALRQQSEEDHRRLQKDAVTVAVGATIGTVMANKHAKSKAQAAQQGFSSVRDARYYPIAAAGRDPKPLWVAGLLSLFFGAFGAFFVGPVLGFSLLLVQLAWIAVGALQGSVMSAVVWSTLMVVAVSVFRAWQINSGYKAWVARNRVEQEAEAQALAEIEAKRQADWVAASKAAQAERDAAAALAAKNAPPAIPAQWLKDPQNPNQYRWWDGVKWTNHTAPVNLPS